MQVCRENREHPLLRASSLFGKTFGSWPGTEVHVAGVCISDKSGEWEVLIAQRTASRQIYPGRWECGGGRVNPGEGFDDAVKRKIFEEFGLDIEVSDLLGDDKIQVKGKPLIPGLRFLCVAGGGEIKLNKREFSHYRWVTFPVPNELQYIDDVKNILDILSTELVSTVPKKETQSVMCSGWLNRKLFIERR